MTEFLSDEAIASHKEYLRQLRLKYAILEDGIKTIKNKDYEEITRQKLNYKDKLEVLSQLSEITLHRIFFDSFCDREYAPCELARLSFGSEAVLLNRIYSECMALPYGFVGVFLERGQPVVLGDTDRVKLLSRAIPRLAVDVCEHTYFLDYGFDKERFLIRALPYLDLNRLN